MDERLYLVVEPITLIAQDLDECIREADDRADVVCVATVGIALTEMALRGRCHAAFLHMDPAAFETTALSARLARDGAQLVFLGDAAESSARQVRVIERPFSAETVRAMMASLKEPPRSAGAVCAPVGPHQSDMDGAEGAS